MGGWADGRPATRGGQSQPLLVDHAQRAPVGHNVDAMDGLDRTQRAEQLGQTHSQQALGQPAPGGIDGTLRFEDIAIEVYPTRQLCLTSRAAIRAGSQCPQTIGKPTPASGSHVHCASRRCHAAAAMVLQIGPRRARTQTCQWQCQQRSRLQLQRPHNLLAR